MKTLFYKIETSAGNISMEKAVVGKIIWEIIEEFQGKVLLSHYKGKASSLVAKIGGIDDLSYMDIDMGPDGLDLKIYVVIKFGTSIKLVTKTILEKGKQNLEEFTGMKVNGISIVVTGMFSKQIVRRNIEIKG